MTDIKRAQHGDWPDPEPVSLRGLYIVGAIATTIGITVVFVLNMATPMDFVLNQFSELSRKQGGIFGFELAKRLLGLLIMISAVCSLTLLVIHQLLRPIADCLTQVRTGKEPRAGLAEKARRRLINLPFVFIPFNLAMWMLIPALIFISAHLTGRMSLFGHCFFQDRILLSPAAYPLLFSPWTPDPAKGSGPGKTSLFPRHRHSFREGPGREFRKRGAVDLCPHRQHGQCGLTHSSPDQGTGL